MYHGHLFELSGPSEGRLCSGKDDCINWWLVLPIRLLYYSGKIQVLSMSLIKSNILVESFNGTFLVVDMDRPYSSLLWWEKIKTKTNH
jgi:hypothetical protein